MKRSKINHYQFPYVRFHGKYYPLVPLTLRHGRFGVSTFALLDSGASVCVFRPEIAKALRINTKKRKAMRLGTASGGVDVSMFSVMMQVQNTRFRASVGFSHHDVASFNILGREGFFRRFSIAFNEISRTVVLVPLETLS